MMVCIYYKSSLNPDEFVLFALKIVDLFHLYY